MRQILEADRGLCLVALFKFTKAVASGDGRTALYLQAGFMF